MAYPTFRAFCFEHAEEIYQLVTTRPVQINEVRRCLALALVFCVLGQRLQGQFLALVEIGTSAELHLLWDAYVYDYGAELRMGAQGSPVRITSAFEGTFPVMPGLPFPSVAYRVGIDLAPLDVRNEDDKLWLQALLWPEHRDSQHLLKAALGLASRWELSLVKGDAAIILPEVLTAVPPEYALCVYHSYTLNQMPRETRESILEHISRHTKQRDLYRVEQEGYSLHEPPALKLFSYAGGAMQVEYLASCETRGRWVKWQHSERA